MTNQFYLDDDCIVSFSISEVGWMLQKWIGRLRYLKHKVYPDYKFVLFTNTVFHPLVEDFVAYTIDLPQGFYDLKLEKDCYESPPPNSPPASLTPPNVYAGLIDYMRTFYNKDKAIEIWPPRGCNFIMDTKPQIFLKYTAQRDVHERPIITVMPRGRARAAYRNVPEFVWKEVVDDLKEHFTVVLTGTPGGSVLVDYEGDNVINLIPYKGQDDIAKAIYYLNNSVCSVSSQGGLTHLSLLCDCPSYIIGDQKERHAVTENRFNTPVSFRYVKDYRAIDAQTILHDIASFMQHLKSSVSEQLDSYDEIVSKDKDTLSNIIQGLR